MSTQPSTRRYRKRRRAEAEAQTRQRITEAAVKLHGSVGPARTTVSGIAKEAGVQRATVYRHFPDEQSLFAACSAHYTARNPPPDPGPWLAVADPDKRLHLALTELYDFYSRTEGMFSRTSRDASLVPAMAGPVQAFAAYLEQVRSALMKGRPQRGRVRDRVSAAIGHAIAFSTWTSLVVQQEMEPSDAAELMARLVAAAATR